MHSDPVSRMDDLSQTLHLSPIMTTASTPATPGPSTPTAVRTSRFKIDDTDQDIVPPIRPKSTPFPEQDITEGNIKCSQRLEDRFQELSSPTIRLSQSIPPNSPLENLPIEIQECILDNLFGFRASASSRATAGRTKGLRSWNSALRHSRRREVSELALVSKKWRVLIQDRLYRHLKIKGTRDSVEQASLWFFSHEHLCAYVKHIEIWFPVFQDKNPGHDRIVRIASVMPDRMLAFRGTPAQLADPGNFVTYLAPGNNCTLEEVFRFVQMTFAEACILTLEGGDRKKPPKVRHLLNSQALPVIDGIRTLVCKGQWNLIRSDEDFQTIAAALPNLGEWHGSYAKPKSKSYLSMATILPKLPKHLTHLNVCLEGDYRSEAVSPRFSKKVTAKTHFCLEMAKAVPTLEHLAYTGRVCHCFFDHAAKISRARDTRLKTVEFIVKNVCRPPSVWNDGSGVTDMGFILAFESMVISGVKALEKLAAVELLRIHFIDLDSQVPALNPYFQLAKNQVTGLWSESILQSLERTRPHATYLEKPGSLGDIGFKDGQLFTPPLMSKTRPLSIKLSTYVTLSGGITIT